MELFSEFFTMTTTLVLLLFVGMVVCLEIGYRIGRKWSKRQVDSEKMGISVIDASIFGLLGLVLAFTVGGAVSRLDHRRQLIIEEANAIGTAYLRLDILAPADRDALRGRFKDYLDSRIKLYELLPDVVAASAEWERSTPMQKEIWALATAAAKTASARSAAVLLLPAINEMFDIATKRYRFFFIHLPTAVAALLMITAWSCSILAGYSLYSPKGRNMVHMLTFAIIISLTFYLILDLDYPRMGIINLRDADKVLIELRQSLG